MTEPKNNNLDPMINLTFRNINRTFFHSNWLEILLQEIVLIDI